MTSLSHPKTTLSVDESGNIIYFNDLRSENVGIARVMKEPSVLSPKELSMRWFILVVFSVFALLVSSRSDAQDVYNFYFQKNAPQQNPALSPAAPTPATVPAAQSTTISEAPAASVAAVTATEKKFRRFEFGVSYGSTSFSEEYKYSDSQGEDRFEMSNGGTGFGIQGGIRFNKYVALDGMFNVTTIKSEEYEDRTRLYQGSFGVLVTPIHINLFGYELLELSASGGVMNGQKAVVKSDFTKDKLQDIDHVYGAYAGGRIAANLTPELAVFFDGKQMLGGGNKSIEMYQLGLKYRF